METKTISKKEKRHVRIESLADKYNCSRQYVSQILDGKAPVNSVLARKIWEDAQDIINIVERETTITL